MIVVCDTSPVNYLVLINEIDLLPQLFTIVVLPAAVLTELQHPRTPPRVASWARDLPPWVRVISPDGPVENVGLGRGEAEAIAIATQVAADAVLIDERKATLVARARGLMVTGTLGVLALAADAKLVDLEGSIRRLLDTNFRASPALIDDILRRS
jgi:predicted nucleic acid-binding protein